MDKKRRIRTIWIVIILLCYFCAFVVPYLQTFGRGYEFRNHFYANFYASYLYAVRPDRCLTLDGRLLKSQTSGDHTEPATITRAVCRIPLTKFNFDNLFQGATWTHQGVDAQWLRQNAKASWIGFKFDDGVLFMDYILKLDDGNLVVCRGILFSTTGGFHPYLSYVEYYTPAGSTRDFYQYIEDRNSRS